MQVAPPGLVYPMTLPGYPSPGIIQHPSAGSRPSSPVKQFQQSYIVPINPRPNTPAYTQVQSRAQTPVHSIIPTREWLLEIFKRCVFTRRGILIGDYPKYEIQKKDITDKFHKRIAELYPSDKYNITKDWISSAIANPEFLPEYGARLDEFPITAEFRIAIKQSDFDKLAQDIAGNVEPYYDIKIDSDRILDINVRKLIVCFRNHFIPEGHRVVFFIESDSVTTPLGILIPPTEMKYQHDYLAYDGNIYSVLDVYQDCIGDDRGSSGDARGNDISVGIGGNYHDTSVGISLNLFEIVNNIRNGVVVFMANVEMEECVEIILAARNKVNYEKQEKKRYQQIPMFDKFISQQVKLDFYLKIWSATTTTSEIKAGDSASDSASAGNCACPRCAVVIESGELVCSTKCCRRTMHPSCLLELYCHEDTACAEFRCDKCSVKRNDKYGRNTEMLMGLCL
jgi:hypothetical protein